MRLKEFMQKGGEVSDYEKNWEKLPVPRKIEYIKGFLTQRGYTINQTAAILGNLLQENAPLSPSNTNPTSKAVGIAQWLGPRKTQLLNNQNPYSIVTQLNHLDKELKGNEHWTNNIGGKKAFFGTDDVEKLTHVIRKDFERPGEAEANDAKRVQNAYAVLGQNYTPSTSGQSYSSPEYMQAPDTSHYNDLIADMSKGLWDWTNPRSQELFQKAPQMVELGLKTYQTQQDLDRRSQLDNERIQQEQIKQQVEQENAQLQQAILAKKQERDQLLSMIPQAKSVSDGPTQVSI